MSAPPFITFLSDYGHSDPFAHLAAGAPLAEAGTPLDPDELVTLVAHALTADAFGNVALDAAHAELTGSALRLGHPVEIEVGGGAPVRAHYGRPFADVAPGAALVYEDADRTLAVAVNRGSARDALGLEEDVEVRLRPA